MNSWRRGFIRWRIREGPIGSHQELARPEKWESSSAETEVCVRVWDRLRVWGGWNGVERLVSCLEGRRARARARPLIEAIFGRLCWVGELVGGGLGGVVGG